jgi:hypothetical protein
MTIHYLHVEQREESLLVVHQMRGLLNTIDMSNFRVYRIHPTTSSEELERMVSDLYCFLADYSKLEEQFQVSLPQNNLNLELYDRFLFAFQKHTITVRESI